MKLSYFRNFQILLPSLLAAGSLSLTSCTSTISGNQEGAMAAGTWVARIPSGAERIEFKGMTYYRYGPDYFVRRNDRFVVVRSPRTSLAEKHSMTSRN